MIISIEWLKEFIEFPFSDDELCEKLTILGLESSLEKKSRILDIELTPNRPDCMSYLGVAREVSLLINKKVKLPQISNNLIKSNTKKLNISSDSLIDCPRYSGVVVNDVNVSKSPNWLKDKLKKNNIQSINSIVDISDGRHPVVEKLLPVTEKFIPNNTYINANNNQIHLLTGPNMAGKSTYLRQVGLIIIMAQIGSYVPASKLNLGIVDRLFTRVGASDNLAGGESTFLVEMIEASNILNNATNKSLILLDEIGRGTSTYDGLSIAWAITEHIHNAPNLKARTIFATHYHELAELENTLERLENHYVQVKEYKETIVFLRSIVKGVGNRSYGIQVGKMAGLPKAVIDRASQILNRYMVNSTEKNNKFSQKIEEELKEDLKPTKNIIKELDLIDINNITPLQALQILNSLKKRNDL